MGATGDYGGEVSETGVLDRVRRLTVELDSPDRWERLSRRIEGFWSGPVQVSLGGDVTPGVAAAPGPPTAGP